MTDKRKLEPSFKLDMNFEEALERFARTAPKEVVASVERSKQKRPPQDESPRRPARVKRESTSSNRNRAADDA